MSQHYCSDPACEITDFTPSGHPDAYGLSKEGWIKPRKEATRFFKTALCLHRENATLQDDNKENIPPEDDVEKVHPKLDQSQKA